jgi:phage-related protein (TIGR01555 family)
MTFLKGHRVGKFRDRVRAWLGVGTVTPRDAEPDDKGVNILTVAEAAMSGRPPVNPWQLPKVPDFAPDPSGMAMDSALAASGGMSIASLYQWAMSGAFSEGVGFLGYPYLAELTQRPEYRRVSEIYASEATRKRVHFRGDAKRIDLIEKSIERFQIWSVMREAVEHDGFFGRSQIYTDVGDDPGTDAGRAELQKPFVAKAKVKKGGLKGFRTVEPFWSYPGQYESASPLHADFYKPKQWFVMSTIVDDSRLMTIVGREMPDMLKPAYSFGGLSLSQMAKPYIDNWLRTRQSVSDLLHSFSTMILATNMANVLGGKTGSGGNLFRRLDLFNRTRDNRGIMAIDKETEEMSNVVTPLGTLDKLLAQSQEQIASVVGIPLVVLLGVTPAGLNASSDGEVRTFYATVKAYQERVLRVPFQKIVDYIQLDIDETIDPTITWEFVDLWEMDEKDKAAIRKSDADVDVAYVGAGIVSNEEVRDRIVQDEDSPYYGVDLSDEAPEPPDIAEEDAAGEKDPDNVEN